MSTMMPAPDRTHAPPVPQEPSVLGELLDRAWTAHDLVPRTRFPRGTPAQVRRAELAHAVEVACQRCQSAVAMLPYRRVVVE